MNIIDNIKSWFGWSQHNRDTNQDDPSQDGNSIIFSIDGFGRPWVYVSLSNTEDKSCESFAKMLHSINAGEYEQNMLDIMVSLSKEKPDLKPGIQTILSSWANILANAEASAQKTSKSAENRPFIRPRNVFLGPDK